jgi:hypothetical protein
MEPDICGVEIAFQYLAEIPKPREPGPERAGNRPGPSEACTNQGAEYGYNEKSK